jgi:hypothetical protein
MFNAGKCAVTLMGMALDGLHQDEALDIPSGTELLSGVKVYEITLDQVIRRDTASLMMHVSNSPSGRREIKRIRILLQNAIRKAGCQANAILTI